jgi:hypothetical protein
VEFWKPIAFAGVIFLGIALVLFRIGRSISLLDEWAERNDYEIIQSERRHLLKGSFTWTSSKGQTVYFVTIRDQQGNLRSGWVRCGGFLTGMFSDNTEVHWNDE